MAAAGLSGERTRNRKSTPTIIVLAKGPGEFKVLKTRTSKESGRPKLTPVPLAITFSSHKRSHPAGERN